jgi:hypothetical protein
MYTDFDEIEIGCQRIEKSERRRKQNGGNIVGKNEMRDIQCSIFSS